jgi:hypothetical protein
VKIKKYCFRVVTMSLYQALSSSNAGVRAVAKAVVAAAKLSGAKERTKKSNDEKRQVEVDELMNFLEGEDTAKKIKKLGIDPRMFKIAVLRHYPYGLPGALPNLIKSFRDLVKQADNNKVNTKHLDEIISRMATDNFHVHKDDFETIYKSLEQIGAHGRNAKVRSKSKRTRR